MKTVTDEDQRLIQEMLNKKQAFFKKAFEALKISENKKAQTFLSIESSYGNSIGEILEKYIEKPVEAMKTEETCDESTSEDVNKEYEEETTG